MQYLTISRPPASKITSYMVVGFAAIGYDKNALNLDFFVECIIERELVETENRVFSQETAVSGGGVGGLRKCFSRDWSGFGGVEGARHYRGMED